MRSFEAYVANRYLTTRKKGAFVRVMVRFARWGIAVGVFAMVITLALMNGFREEIQANLFSATSHFSVFHLAGDIPDTAAALKAVRGTKGVRAASPIRREKGLLRLPGVDGPPAAVAVNAIDPGSARSTSSLLDSVKPIRIEDLREGEIVLGRELANNLQLRVGDTVAIATLRLQLGLSGLQPKLQAFKVAGIFQSHISEYDTNWVFVHILDAERLARTDQAETIEVRAADTEAIGEAKAAVLAALNQEGRGGFMTTDLRDTNKALFEALKVEKWIFTAILSLIVLVAAFNIVASLVLFVTEKRRDLGVLLSLGATPRQIRRLFEWQGLRIGAVGTLWGLGLSVPFCLVADRYKLVKLPSAVYDFITYIPFRLHLSDLLFVTIFPLLVAWLASRYPARRAAALNPVDALRAE
ncbi:MAG: ABC transporter permease [Holophagaceae bacterium]|nr:ABC transporter permease [Holophagaceae bacterium]